MFSFTGRINRSTFFLGMLLYAAMVIPIYFIPDESVAKYENDAWFTIVMLSFVVVMLWVSASLHIRRLHDLGLSGWFLLLMIIPFASFMLLFLPGKETTQFGPKPTRLFDLHKLFQH